MTEFDCDVTLHHCPFHRKQHRKNITTRNIAQSAQSSFYVKQKNMCREIPHNRKQMIARSELSTQHSGVTDTLILEGLRGNRNNRENRHSFSVFNLSIFINRTTFLYGMCHYFLDNTEKEYLSQ